MSNNRIIVNGCDIRIARNDITMYYGFKLPNGAIYGKDGHGIFVCTNFNIARIEKVGHDHYDGERLVSEAKTKEYLRVYRLAENMRNAYNSQAVIKTEIKFNYAFEDWELFVTRRNGAKYKTKRYTYKSYEDAVKAQRRFERNASHKLSDAANRNAWKCNTESNVLTKAILDLIDSEELEIIKPETENKPSKRAVSAITASLEAKRAWDKVDHKTEMHSEGATVEIQPFTRDEKDVEREKLAIEKDNIRRAESRLKKDAILNAPGRVYAEIKPDKSAPRREIEKAIEASYAALYSSKAAYEKRLVR